MNFEARKLRVQLPCGDATLIACYFGSCKLPSVLTCLWRTPYCPLWMSDCKWRTFPCPEFSGIECQYNSEPITRTIPTCGISEDWTIDVDELPILQQQLEGQLKLVNEALQTAEKQRKTMK
jgi:hypothetical protein